jgi:Cu/Ag efflux pump CusA
MSSWIIGSSLKFRFLMLAVAFALLVFGTGQLRKMPVDVFPEFAPLKVEVQTEGPRMTSAEVEELITIPMEDQLRGVPGVEYVRSWEVELVPTPNKIRRENNSRRIDVHADVKGRDLGSVAEEVNARLEKINFPIGYYPHLLGEYKERQAAQVRGQQWEV